MDNFFDRYFFRSAGMVFAIMMVIVFLFALCITVASKNPDYGIRVLLIAGSFSLVSSLAATAWGRSNEIIPMGDDEIEETMHAGLKSLKRFSPFIAAGFVPPMLAILESGGGR